MTDRLSLGVGETQVDDISEQIRYVRKYKEILDQSGKASFK